MRIVDKKEIYNINGQTYQVKSIKTGSFYTGVQIIFKKVIVLWITGLAIELNDTKVYIKHFTSVLRPGYVGNELFSSKWSEIRKPFNHYERESLIRTSIQIKESNPLTKLLQNLIKTIK